MTQMNIPGIDPPRSWPWPDSAIAKAWQRFRDMLFLLSVCPELLEVSAAIARGEVEEHGICGCGKLREELRSYLKLCGSEHQLSNNLTAYLARETMRTYSDLAGLIAIKSCPADVPFACLG